MNGNGRRPASPADRMINVIIAVIILAVLGVASYAVYGKISDNLEEKAISEGTKEATINYTAKQQGKTVKEFLSEYGVENSGLKGSQPISDMYGKMTVENFAKYSGQELDAFLEEYKLKDKVSKDDLWEDAELKLPLGVYIGGDDYIEQFKEVYELDASVTKDTPWGDVKETVEKKQEEMKNATPAPETTAAAEAPAEAETTDTASDAPTEAPAE